MIRELREAKKLTQEQLARRARVARGYLAQLEAGHKENPSLPTLKRLAKALGVPVGDLLMSKEQREFPEWAREFLESREYQSSLVRRLRQRKVRKDLLNLLFAHARDPRATAGRTHARKVLTAADISWEE